MSASETVVLAAHSRGVGPGVMRTIGLKLGAGVLALLPVVLALALFVPAFAEQAVPENEPPSQEDADRTPLHTVVPAYPKKAWDERLEGEVQVCFYVDRSGIPNRIAVRNSTHRIFERPSIRAVQASTYEPLSPGEELPRIKSCRTFRFSLEPAEVT